MRYEKNEKGNFSRRILIYGAGGSINEDGILDASLTPRMIQPTTFAEISGKKSERTKQFYAYMKRKKK